jgi:hypothetical protein
MGKKRTRKPEKKIVITDNCIVLYKFQQDAHVTEFILSDNCSTCFGRYHHPSSGAQTTVTTASNNSYTVIDKVKFTDKDYLQIR